ncbi:MAG: class II aldolase/adducin family protein [Ectothiorhodospiraceae bacterium]|nr:class II aldolase/adducin family protein [Ectothiorhodospiraceae bacterium]
MNDATIQTTDQQVRVDLAAAHRLAVMDDLHEGTWNHFSVMSPSQPELMIITPGDTHWSQIRASELTVMGPQAEIVSGREPNPAAWIIHYPVHRARPDAQCLMHIHAPYSTALCMRKDWKLDTRCCQAAAFFHGRVAYFDEYDGDLRDASEGERMAAALGDKSVLLMRNHGALVAAPTIGRAYMDLYLLERACKFQMLAAGDGHELGQIPERIATKMGNWARDVGREGHFAGMKRVLDAREPDYAH